MNKEAPKEILGVKIDNPKVGYFAPAVFIALSRLAAKEGLIKVEGGHLPRTGPALVVANHRSGWDGIKLIAATILDSKRSLTMVVKDTLLDPSIKEEPEVLKRIGHRKDLYNTSSKILGYLLSKIIGSNRPIPVHRGKPGLDFFRSLNTAFSQDQMVGFLIQESRRKNLSHPMDGPALVSHLHPDLPVCLVGLYDNVVNIGPTINKREIVEQLGLVTKDISAMTGFMVNEIAQLLPAQYR